MTVTVRPNRLKADAHQPAKPKDDDKKSPAVSRKDERGQPAQTPGFVRLADVAMVWQASRNWCGVAALDLEPGGAEELDLRLPEGCELIQASIEDMPAAPRRIGNGVWRLALASSDSLRRIGVIFRGVMPEMDGAGRLRFEPPTVGDLPVRRTLWTVFLPPSWSAENPQGAALVSGRPGNLPWPGGVAAIGETLSPRYYLSEGGAATLTFDCRQASSGWPFHRWAAAIALLFLGVSSASVVIWGKRRKAGSHAERENQ